MQNVIDRVGAQGAVIDLVPGASAPVVPALPPTSAGPAVERPRRRGLLLRLAVPFVAAAPVLLQDVHAGALLASVLLLAALVDLRRPPALETLPFARTATTVGVVAAAAVLGAIASVAFRGALPSPDLVALSAALAAAGLLVAGRLESRRTVVRVVVLGTAVETAQLERTTVEVGSRRFRVAAGTDSLTELEQLVADAGADLVVYTDHVARPAVLGHVAAMMRHRRVRAMHLDRFCEHALGVVPLAAVDATWLADLADPSSHGGRENVAGRALDVVVSAVLLVLVAPVLLVLLPLIALDREGGPFFRQARVGRDGRPFQILKLRTMRGTGTDWSAPGDPRVTRLGALLRRTHVDELPQLWNVLRGDMALVGPRPEQVHISADLEREVPLFPYRHLVRPGITGWARVRTGYARTAEESALKLGNDLFYIKHRSLLLDVAVLLETLRVALFEDQFAVQAPAAAYVLGPDRVTADEVYAERVPVPAA